MNYATTQKEDVAYKALVDVARESAKPEAAEVRRVYVVAAADELCRNHGLSLSKAREVVEARCKGALEPNDMVHCQNNSIVSVFDILADPERYDRQPCADPLEPEEGTSKAMIFANRDTGKPVINSMLHGGRVFHLQARTPDKVTEYNEGVALGPTEVWQQDHIKIGHAFRDIDADGKQAIEYVLDHAIQAGLAMLAAATGIGKTTAIVPLAARVAWLVPGCPLTPKIMRQVIIITEDSHQVALILRAMVEAGEIPNREALKDRFKVLDAVRLPPDTWADIVATYSKYETPTTLNGVTIQSEPLVILDTKSAVLDLEEENSNTENSRAIAAIRQRTRCPVLVITHIAKAQKGQDASMLSARGADSQVADAQQLLTMSIDPLNPNARWLEIAGQKHRFRSAYDGISFELRTADCVVTDAFGQEIIETVAYGHPVPVLAGERGQARRQAEELSQDIKGMILRNDIFRAIDQLVSVGSATSKSAIHKEAGGRKNDVLQMINEMVDAGQLVATNAADAGLSAAKRGQVVYLRPDDLPVPEQAKNES